MMRENGARKNYITVPEVFDLRFLRLTYLDSVSGKATNWDVDMGETKKERDAFLQAVHVELAKDWAEITNLVSTQDPVRFIGCNRPYCYCHKCRLIFAPGSVWEPPVKPSN